jgi:hypothetical protein
MLISDRRRFLALAGAAALAPVLPIRAVELPPADLVADAQLLRRLWEALHPGLYRYNSPATLDARFAAFERWAGAGRRLGDAYVAFGRLAAALKCGHSFPNPFNQPKTTREALFTGRDRVPFAFAWLDGRMVVIRPFAGVDLPPGTEVLAIDGEPAPTILERLLPLARADGSNDAKRVANLEVTGEERLAAFDVYRALTTPASKGELRLRVRPFGGRVRDLVVPAMTEAERQAARSGGGGDEAARWRFEIMPGGVVLLRMPSWAVFNDKDDWKPRLDGFLDRLVEERARGLVVDLRGNEGGLDCGDRILARLIDRDLEVPPHELRTRYRRVPAAFEPYLDTWDKSFLDWGAAAIGPRPDGSYRLTREDEVRDRIRPGGRRFRGRVAVLVDAACSSATFGFAQIVKASGVATLVGMPTGGNQRGINGGAYFFARLPATGVEIDIPLIGYFPSAPKPDAGIMPDIVVRPTAQAIATGADPTMTAAVRKLLAV